MPNFSISPSRFSIFKPAAAKVRTEDVKTPAASAEDKLDVSRSNASRGTSLRDLAASGRVPFHSLNGRMTCGDYNL